MLCQSGLEYADYETLQKRISEQKKKKIIIFNTVSIFKKRSGVA